MDADGVAAVDGGGAEGAETPFGSDITLDFKTVVGGFGYLEV